MEPLGASVDAVVRFDHATLRAVYELRGPLVTKVLTSVTGLGSASAALVFLGVFRLAGWERELRRAGAALAVTGLVVGALMATVQRPFPPNPVCVTDGAETVAHSFPSGHAAAVTVFALVSRRSSALPFAPVAALAALVAFSRVYLGTHYLSDTLVGVLVGVGALVLADRALERFDPFGADA
jgi:undecaprenyl-diphosphatase